jgi:hypothetical protein
MPTFLAENQGLSTPRPLCKSEVVGGVEPSHIGNRDSFAACFINYLSLVMTAMLPACRADPCLLRVAPFVSVRRQSRLFGGGEGFLEVL